MNNASAIPRLVSPRNAEVVDGAVVEFSWQSEISEFPFELSLSATPDFEISESLEVGLSQSVTLYDLLPQNGSTYYWRVRSTTADGTGEWSQSDSFVVGTDDQILAVPTSVAPAQKVAPRVAAPRLAVEQVDGTTSVAYAVGFISIMIGSFIVLLILLRSVVL